MKAGGKSENANNMEIGAKTVIHRNERDYLVYRYLKNYSRSFKGLELINVTQIFRVK